ncbi:MULTISPECIES: hypothetical protein [unclassified Curtobacterium]|uniref:hypothetical protein n=1 Tax=unclassified Curtobacterium TaxID=257496 RepID=UPI00034A45D1|nr:MULTISPECIES: hypothetical protein [unclassified Curtobacterium]
MTRPHPGTRRPLTRAASWSAALVGVVVLTSVLAGCTGQTRPGVEDTYGGMPSYLATIPSTTDEVLDGSAAHPALTSEGDAVRVHLQDGATVTATVTGPVVPGEGLPHQGETTTCTWTVSLRGTSGSVPVSLSDMTTIDQLGNVYRLSPVAGKGTPPRTLRAGQRVTFELRTVMKVGEGVLRWAPGGGKTLAEWDFEVEND